MVSHMKTSKTYEYANSRSGKWFTLLIYENGRLVSKFTRIDADFLQCAIKELEAAGWKGRKQR